MMLTWELLGTWLAVAFTLFIYTFPFKDNPLYRFSEHVFVGSAAGFAVVMGIKNIRDYAWMPMTTKGEWAWIIPMILGILLYFRFSGKYYWVSRYGLGVIIAIGTAIAMRTLVEAQFLAQIRLTVLNPLATAPKLIAGTPKIAYLNNILIIIMVITVVTYFIFTGGTKIQPTRTISTMREIGKYSMMVAFGATFGSTIMTRVAFFIERTTLVIAEEARIFLPFAFLLIALAMIPRGYYERAKILKKR
ncbi:MAG: hypothetical protein AOA65_0342 [Candidatus Bathyarchaeota archaeon BA1]|nr:MAG: hypothetical protein AOA65_0342 [Candidatus Bathyarchaeota archaeon BA1]